MKIQAKILISLVIVIVFVLGFLAWGRQGMTIITDKKEYESGEILRMNIKNNLGKDICFSSCYPYYLEKRDKKWESYPYGGCERKDLIEKCIEPASSKTFEITLSLAKEGAHRIALPVCINCKIGDEFKESKRFYSNGFTVK